MLMLGDEIGGRELFQCVAFNLGATVFGQVNDRHFRPLFAQSVGH